MGPGPQDVAILSQRTISLRGVQGGVVENELGRFSTQSHLVAVLHEPLGVWVDGSVVTFDGCASLARPVWYGPDHLTLISQQRQTEKLFKVDVKLVPTTAVGKVALAIDGKPLPGPGDSTPAAPAGPRVIDR